MGIGHIGVQIGSSCTMEPEPVRSVYDCETLRTEHTISFPSKIRELAKQLVSFEAVARPAPSDVEFRACDKLHPALRSLAGTASVHALLSRALVLSKAQFPRLASVKLKQDGSLEGLSNIDPPLNKEEAAEGEVILIANMVNLLCTFVGETLAVRLIQGVWPNASLVDEVIGNEGKA